ncbi:MAG: NUDIX domain-containing protein [Dehalococcoidales bacterium]|jgi:ADP-ribose pyrophosphatase YjhB (NUDIX family)
MNRKSVRVIAICVFRHGNRILTCDYLDEPEMGPFYRPLGGKVEFGEKTIDTVRREIREEIGQEVTDLKLLTVLENIFSHEDDHGHEIVYVYDGKFTDPSVYQQAAITVNEDDILVMTARWHELDFFNDYHRLVPNGLLPLLKKPG